MPLWEFTRPSGVRGALKGCTQTRAPAAAELATLSMPELRALGGLREGLAAVDELVEGARLALYRNYVRATVSQVSPLLLRWCALERVDLRRLALDLRPDRPWISWLCGPRPTPGARRRHGAERLSTRPGGGLALDALHRFAFSGIVVGGGTPAVFGIRVLHRRLEFACFPGGARLRTFGVGGSILLPGELPATLVAALPGRCLDRLVGHPLLDGAGCVVREVRRPTHRGTEILFALPPSSWSMPWAGS
jgi:hypothetical protein